MKNKAKIFVVEDNPASMELFQDILDMAGYTSVFTGNGEEAMEIAKREKPDLILLDIQLPGMDGMTVKKLLRTDVETKDIKIIALTAHAMKGDRESFLEEGFDGYIAKPIIIKDFLKEIEEYLLARK